MSKTLLIIVTGAPCTGKTTLAQRIAREFGLPLVHRDGIKETLFDSLGWKDRRWSRKLGAASVDLLYHFMEVLLRAGQSCVVESNFYRRFAEEELLDPKRRCPFEIFQILCKAKGEVLLQRFKQRSESGERHPGHVDHLTYEEIGSSLLQGDRWRMLNIGGRAVEVDTTDFALVDHEGLFRAIRSALERA